jgi:hypothetical protein
MQFLNRSMERLRAPRQHFEGSRAGSVPSHRTRLKTVTHRDSCYFSKFNKEVRMAKFSKSAGTDVKRAVKKQKKGTLKSGKGGKGGTVKSRKQAIAIGLSETRKKDKKAPKKKAKKNN